MQLGNFSKCYTLRQFLRKLPFFPMTAFLLKVHLLLSFCANYSPNQARKWHLSCNETVQQCEHQDREAWPRHVHRSPVRQTPPAPAAAQAGAGQLGLYQVRGDGVHPVRQRRRRSVYQAGALGGCGRFAASSRSGGGGCGFVWQHGVQRLRVQHTRGVHPEGGGEELAQPVSKGGSPSNNAWIYFAFMICPQMFCFGIDTDILIRSCWFQVKIF